MKKITALFFSGFFLLINSTVIFAVENEFDILCSAFTQLDQQKSVEEMSNIQRNEFILQTISKTLPVLSNARSAWLAVDSAVAGMRYELIIGAAEPLLHKKWQCASMQKWARLTGEF